MKRDIDRLTRQLVKRTVRPDTTPTGPPKPAANHPWRRSHRNVEAG